MLPPHRVIGSAEASEKLLKSSNFAANLFYHRAKPSILPSYQLASVLLDQCSVFLAVAGAWVEVRDQAEDQATE